MSETSPHLDETPPCILFPAEYWTARGMEAPKGALSLSDVEVPEELIDRNYWKRLVERVLSDPSSVFQVISFLSVLAQSKDIAGEAYCNRFTQEQADLILNLGFRRLNRANFDGLHVAGGDFRYAQLKDATFRNTNCEGTNFDDANCSSARFDRANCKDASFCGTNNHDANFWKADLRGTDFIRANNHWATFNRSNLRGARLERSDCTDATFDESDLRGASFKDSVCIDATFNNAQWESAISR